LESKFGGRGERRDLILIRKSTVSRRAAASGLCPDPIRVALVVWWAGSGGGFEGDLVAEGLELADVVALGAFGTAAGVVEARAQVLEP
jgi:hypothetical protein